MAHIRVLHGPNLNLLGTREPEVYGSDTLEDINQRLETQARSADVEISFSQSNAEHAIVEAIQSGLADEVDYFVINPGAFTHTSIAIRDAFSAVDVPFIEVHLSNVHAREGFRQHSYLSDIAQGVILGLGAQGYELALQAAISQLNKPRK
ncbi:MAG: type II 3-dehydroquinate dehydratase [Proteobacteria bacterium]|nr:type II 3-dehydroquinate dehydratase [Pseudomonadota bacterium]